MTGDNPVVLVVAADPDDAERYAGWLRERWTSRIAYDADQASEALDGDVSVVLVDRQLPDDAREAVVTAIRERDLHCRVALLSPSDPGPSIPTEYDAYLVEPVDEETLYGTVRELLLRSTYDEYMAEYYELAVEKARLETENDGRLADDEHYREVDHRLSTVSTRVDEVLAELSDHESYAQLCRELSRHIGGLDGVNDLPTEL